MRLRHPNDTTRLWLHGTMIFCVSRLFVLVGAALVAVFKTKSDPVLKLLEATPTRGTFDVLTAWDGQWYRRIVEHGYPRHVPPHVTYFQDEARAAFFPLFPALGKVADVVLPKGADVANLAVAWVAGAVAVALIGVLAHQVYGPRVALRAVVLVSLFPGSFVLSYAYSESVLLVCVAACLLALHHERWVLAGLAAALATATRPNAIALCLACAVAAFVAIRDRRDWWALAAPLLSPLGYIGFQAYLGQHTGESGVWFRVQNEAWDERVSLGTSTARSVFDALLHPLSSPHDSLTLFTVAALVLMVLACRKVRLPAPWWAYSLGIALLMLLPTTVGPRPRFLFTAFPLLIGVAAWWPERDREWWAYLLAVMSAMLVAVVALVRLHRRGAVTTVR